MMQTRDLMVCCMHLIRRWWGLVLLAGLMSGGTALYLIQATPAQYVARVTLMVGTNLRSKSPNEQADRMITTLAPFYAEMARRMPITEPVVEKLKLPFEAKVLNQYLVATRVIPQAQLIEIDVLDTDARRAASIANAIANELIAFSPTSPEDIEALRAFVQTQLNDLEERIRNTEEQIKRLKIASQSMTSAGEIAEAQQRLREFEALKASDQATYGGLLSNLEGTATNTLSLFEPATLPTISLPRRMLPVTVLGIVLGCALGLAGAWGLEMLDNVWRRGRHPELVVREPVLGAITPGPHRSKPEDLLATPRGQQSLALRSEMLLRLAATARPMLMLTSARSSEERSRLSVDLAQLFACSGQRTLLVDAGLGKASATAALGVVGDGTHVLLRDPECDVGALVQPTDQNDLVLLSAGEGKQAAPLLPTLNWPQAVDAVKRYAAEVTVVDGPPVLEAADAVLAAPRMDGVVLVIDPATERCSDTRQAVMRLHMAGAPLLGVVLLTPADEQRPLLQRLRSLLSVQQPVKA